MLFTCVITVHPSCWLVYLFELLTERSWLKHARLKCNSFHVCTIFYCSEFSNVRTGQLQVVDIQLSTLSWNNQKQIASRNQKDFILKELESNNILKQARHLKFNHMQERYLKFNQIDNISMRSIFHELGPHYIWSDMRVIYIAFFSLLPPIFHLQQRIQNSCMWINVLWDVLHSFTHNLL